MREDGDDDLCGPGHMAMLNYMMSCYCDDPHTSRKRGDEGDMARGLEHMR
jgi:hypothetical protein